MKHSTLKRLSIAMCSLIMVLCSEVKSAQDLTDPEIMASNKTKLFYQNEDTQLSNEELISPQTIKLEESSVSWAPYLFTPFKSAVDNAYNIIKYATQNPSKAMIIGLMLVANITAVAAECECCCKYHVPGASLVDKGSWVVECYGTASNIQMCSNICKQNSLSLQSCR